MKLQHVNLLTLVSVVFALSACLQSKSPMDSANSSSGTDDPGSLDAGIRNQKPYIRCELMRGGEVLRVLDTDSRNDQFMAAARRMDNLELNCTQTSDDQTIPQQLRYSIDFGDGTIQTQGQAFVHSYNAPGNYDVTIRVSDSLAAEQVKRFTLAVECTVLEVAPLFIDTSKITAVPGAKPNEFNYSAAGAVSGGRGTYQYSWDFNGDDFWDLYTNAAPKTWSDTDASPNVYTVFANRRMVGLTARDKECNITARESVAVDFAIERVPAGSSIPVSIIKPHHFLQADVRGVNGLVSKHANADFIARQDPMAPNNQKKHAQCGYNKPTMSATGALSISGMNWYGLESSQILEHGLRFEVRNIPDNGGMALQRYSSADMAAVKPQMVNARYFTPESSDQQTRFNYDESGGCNIEITVERAQAAVPCNGDAGQTIERDAVILNGKFSCPNLRITGTSAQVKLDEGYFFCEVQSTNQCPGGGGGGGGQPPTPR